MAPTTVPPWARGWPLGVDVSDEWSESNPFFWAAGTLPSGPGLGRQVRRFREPLLILALVLGVLEVGACFGLCLSTGSLPATKLGCLLGWLVSSPFTSQSPMAVFIGQLSPLLRCLSGCRRMRTPH